VFICENNHYSELTPIDEMVRMNELYRRAEAYGFPSRRIDGNDPDAVRSATRDYLERARTGEGPALIEAMTQRIVGHYYGDMQGYRPRGEVTQALLEEPIVRAREALIASGEATAEELERVTRSVREEIAAAAAEAQAAPLASAANVREHLYA
jgi:pyruvate dehydrogenase E1 component alpha subunit